MHFFIPAKLIIATVYYFIAIQNFMENDLVTGHGTKFLTVEEYDKIIQAIPESKRAIEINTKTGLRYIELQRLYDNAWYYKERNQSFCRIQTLTKQKAIKAPYAEFRPLLSHV